MFTNYTEDKVKVDVFFHKEQHPCVDVDNFIQEFKEKIKFKQSSKVFFINSPRIKNIVNTNIDLLLIIAIENKKKNFYIVKDIDKYFNNLIIPIKFITEFKNDHLQFPEGKDTVENFLVNDDMEVEIKSEIMEMKYRTSDYLSAIWEKLALELGDNYEQEIPFRVYAHPLIWILNDKGEYDFRYANMIYAPKFGFNEIEAYLRYASHKLNFFSSVYNWSNKDNIDNKETYQLIDKQIEALQEQLEKDNKIGSLTKKKIDLLNKKYKEDIEEYESYIAQKEIITDPNIIFEETFGVGSRTSEKIKKLSDRIVAEKNLKNNIVIIKGAAGSGKTFEMMLLIKKVYEATRKEDQTSGYYLTYNKLLAIDVKCIIDNYQTSGTKTVVKTIHKFFYDIAVNVTILSIMTQRRCNELCAIQDKRCQSFCNYIENTIKNTDEVSYDSVDALLRKNIGGNIDLGTKEYCLQMLSTIRRNNNKDTNKKKLIATIENYNKTNKEKIRKKVGLQVFFSDYYQVLRYILMAIREPEKLYNELNIKDLSVGDWGHITKDKVYPKDLNGFCRLIKNSLRVTRGRGKILFVDEAQDCHPLERDILLSLWQEKGIVVATGGKEQLIRHTEECHWEINDLTEKLLVSNISLDRRKNYRMKPNILKLCNFIAKEFGIEFNLTAYNTKTEDLGTVIIEFDDPMYSKLKMAFKELDDKGKANNLSNYENILFLTESNSILLKQQEEIGSITDPREIAITENNNIVPASHQQHKVSTLAKILGISNQYLFLHNQEKDSSVGAENNDEYQHEEIATAKTYRGIYYESCRGLEAWSVMCLDIDVFFQRKKNEDIASSFLSDLFRTEEECRNKYAATWLLMALTRPIDSLYIHIRDKNSYLGKVFQKYVNGS